MARYLQYFKIEFHVRAGNNDSVCPCRGTGGDNNKYEHLARMFSKNVLIWSRVLPNDIALLLLMTDSSERRLKQRGGVRVTFESHNLKY